MFLLPSLPSTPAGTRTIVGNLSDLLKTSCVTKLTFLELDRAKDGEAAPAITTH